MTTPTPLNIRLPSHLREALTALAAKRRLSLNELIKRILAGGLEGSDSEKVDVIYNWVMRHDDQ
jgi:hypothetical protein